MDLRHILGFVLALGCAGHTAVQAAFNVAQGQPIIDSSGQLGGFPVARVTDGSYSDGSDFWLGREGTVNEYFTVDLGQLRSIQTIGLCNTHNASNYDRGTQNFRVYAAQTVDGANQLIGPQLVLQSHLPTCYGWAPVPRVDFTVDTGLTAVSARYLRFETVTSSFGNNHVGLNEIEVYESKLPAFQQPATGARRIIDASGSYSASFAATKALDGSYTDAFSSDYWLGRDGRAQEYFTVDLGDLYYVDEVRLRNTHNGGYNDRGTQNFRVYGSDTLDMFYQLLNPQLVLQGTLNSVAGQSPVPAQLFGPGDGLADGNYRYLRFETLTAISNNAGLNEIDFDLHPPIVPEPGALAIALVAGAALARRRPRR